MKVKNDTTAAALLRFSGSCRMGDLDRYCNSDTTEITFGANPIWPLLQPEVTIF
jgi:hypothetical protein